MKNLLVLLLAIATLGLSSCSEVTSSTAPKGTDFGGGGDAYGAEFIDIARTVVRRWKGTPEKTVGEARSGGVSVEKFEKVVSTLKVKTTEEELSWGDQRVDALNYPDKGLVVLSLKHWSTAPFSEKRRLVIHEILGLMGIELSLRYELTLYVLSNLDFYREVPIYEFLVDSKPAQMLVEKIVWLPEEITKGEYNDTIYRMAVKGVRKDSLTCVKSEFTNPDTNGPLFLHRCYIHCDAFMTDEPSIRLQPDISGELYARLFGGKEFFDFGFVKGENGSALTPTVSLYFDRSGK